LKIAIVSDIHGNMDALLSFPESYDELWVLGDLVNYGPQPKEVVDFVRSEASLVVRGNHDHSVGFATDPRCSPRFRGMADVTGRFTASVLAETQKAYLRFLPLHIRIAQARTVFSLCHATLSDPLFEYRACESSAWLEECGSLDADVVFVGHTHVPCIRRINGKTLVNPGSLGQPKTGKPDACYAVWEDGEITLRSYRYPVEQTVERIEGLAIDAEVKKNLVAVLTFGGMPTL
jgi:putative phosphoesterase